MMNRRDFIKNIAPLAVVPFFSNRLFASIPQLSQEEHALLSNVLISDNRVLVVVQMTGGNDGLNMVLPLDQYTNLAAARSNVLIPDTSALTLGAFPTGLHPAMTGLHNMYNNNRLSVVQSVGYTNFNFSHFRATDILMSGSDSNQVIDSGWLGRYLEYYYPGFPAAYPNATEPDPLAISIGSSLSQALQGYLLNTSQSVPTNFTGVITQLLSYVNTTTPSTPAGNELAFIRHQQGLANQYATSVINAWNAGANLATYPAPPAGNWSQLAQQLKVVARLIKGGLRTKVYWVTIGGFDTHANQVDYNDHTIGAHANLMKELSDSIAAFQADLALLGIEDRVLGMTSTEFGRRLKSNSSSGTDHGTASPVFMFGKFVNPTVIGTNPVIPANVTGGTNLPLQFDYRELYMSVLQNWFCLSAQEATTVMMNNQAPINAVIAPCGVLPIELVAFRAEKINLEDVHISWSTVNEQNTASFEIERSLDEKVFTSIATLPAAGHSHELLSYDFTDQKLPIHSKQVFYYRLKMIDIDGDFAYSEIRRVGFNKEDFALEFQVFPNPSTDGSCQITLNQAMAESSFSEIILTDLFGRVLAQQSLHLSNEPQSIDFGQGIPSGVYYISIKNDLGSQSAKWIVK